MKLPALAAGVVSLSISGIACDTGPDPDATGARLETAAPTGTTGTAEVGESEPSLPQELPDSASPLAFIGGVGLLSLAGAAGVRLIRRR